MKRRIHFHEFLREMNRRLVNEPRGDDRLGSVSRQWLDGVALLCFDEFHVHDIADAFLIGRFLEIALELGTRIVLSSNYAPQGLLPNPEFHERFGADYRADQATLRGGAFRWRARSVAHAEPVSRNAVTDLSKSFR